MSVAVGTEARCLLGQAEVAAHLAQAMVMLLQVDDCEEGFVTDVQVGKVAGCA
jgi:hypothetical protein